MSKQTQQTGTSSNDNAVSTKYILNALRDLIELLEYETHLLIDGQVARIGELQSKKLDLINFISAHKTKLVNFKEAQSGFTQEDKDDIMNLVQKLQEVCGANKTRLEKEVKFRQELAQIIAELVASKRSTGVTYTQNGKRDEKSLKLNPPSISLNDKV